MHTSELEAAGIRVARIYAEFLGGLEDRRVAPVVDRSALRGRFDHSIGQDGVGLQGVIDEIEEVVLPSAMTTPHPCYAGLVNSSPLPMAPLADMIVSMLNNNGGAFHQSPPATTAEEEVVRAFCEVIGYPEDAAGMLLPGGTFANLQGLLLGRSVHFPDWRSKGAQVVREPRVYTSRAAHFSIAKTANTMGIGEDHVVGIPALGRGSVDVGEMRAQIRADRDAGRHPFAVVATIGTTGTGAVDDIAELGELCESEGLWLHVDACYGGAAALLPELRGFFAGIERADSIAIDPHKWFFMPITAGLLLTRHRGAEESAFGFEVSYIPSEPEPDPFMRGVPTSRRSSGLAVWATLRAHGWCAIRDAVRRNIEQTRHLESRLRDAGFSVLSDGRMSIACARFEPPGRSPEELDELQQAISRRVIASGQAWFATTLHEGQLWLRFNIVNLHTRAHHVERIADAVIATAKDLT